MGDYYRRPFMSFCKHAAKPFPRCSRFLDQILRLDAPEVFCPNLTEVTQGLLSAPRGYRSVPCGSEVSPHCCPQKTHSSYHNFIVIHDANSLISGRLHRLKRFFEVAPVVLMISRHIQHRACESSSGPFDSSDTEINVARQYDQIRVMHLRHEDLKLVVQV